MYTSSIKALIFADDRNLSFRDSVLAWLPCCCSLLTEENVEEISGDKVCIDSIRYLR